MEKVGVAKLVDFRRVKNQGPKFTFVKNLSKPKAENSDGGGNYWISCISASAAAFWEKDKIHLDNKIDHLRERIQESKAKQTKDQFQKNIDILFAMQEFDFELISPEYNLKKQSVRNNVIQVNNLPIQVLPQKVFSYEIDQHDHIGGVWFVAKKGGYKNEELGMFTTALHKYLAKRFSEKFIVDPNYCIAVDVSSVKAVSYSQILDQEFPDLLTLTIDDLKKLIK